MLLLFTVYHLKGQILSVEIPGRGVSQTFSSSSAGHRLEMSFYKNVMQKKTWLVSPVALITNQTNVTCISI